MFYSTVGHLVFAIIALKTCSSLECYSCGSQVDLSSGMKNDCDYFSYSWYDKFRQMHCMDSDSVCAKYIVDHDGSRWIHRSCQRYDICSQLSKRYSNGMNMLLECETCADSDLCNFSLFHKASFYSVASMLLALFFVK